MGCIMAPNTTALHVGIYWRREMVEKGVQKRGPKALIRAKGGKCPQKGPKHPPFRPLLGPFGRNEV